MKSNGRATVEDEGDGELAAGPEVPPGEGEGDDEEGRFFGGGISNDTAEVLNFIDEREKEDIAVRATMLTTSATSMLIQVYRRSRESTRHGFGDWH